MARHSKCSENIWLFYFLLFLLPQVSFVPNENLSYDSCPQSVLHFPVFTGVHIPALMAAHSQEGVHFEGWYDNLPEESTQIRTFDSELKNSYVFQSLWANANSTGTSDDPDPGLGLQELIREVGGGQARGTSQHPGCPFAAWTTVLPLFTNWSPPPDWSLHEAWAPPAL